MAASEIELFHELTDHLLGDHDQAGDGGDDLEDIESQINQAAHITNTSQISAFIPFCYLRADMKLVGEKLREFEVKAEILFLFAQIRLLFYTCSCQGTCVSTVHGKDCQWPAVLQGDRIRSNI